MSDPFANPIVFHLGSIPVTEVVIQTWGVMAVLVASAILLTRRARIGRGRWAMVATAAVALAEDQFRTILRRDPRPFMPLLATLFVFITASNLSELIPGMHAPTARPETTAALALIVFVAVHISGLASQGIRGYLRHYADPNLLFIPLHIASELTRTFSLMVRLCGNILSHGLVIAIILSLVGWLVPVPFMILGVLTGVVQAYIFTILAAVYLGAATEAADGAVDHH